MWFNFHVSKKLSGGLAYIGSNGGIAYTGRFLFKGSTKSNKIIKVEFSYLPCIRGKTDTSDVFGSKFDLRICSSILLCESIVIEK